MGHDISAEGFGDSPRETQNEHSQLAVPPCERDHRQGSLNAKVVLVEYGDYQCPRCGELNTLIQIIQEQLDVSFSEQNNFCFIFRHFPQPQHPQAQKAAAAAEAAAA